MKTKLDLDKQKNLFNKYNAQTLYSLEMLYDISKNKRPIGLGIIKKQKDTQYVKDFSLNEVIENLSELEKEELNYITELIIEAIGKIDPTQKEFEILPKLIDYLKLYNNEKLERIKIVKDNASLSDIRRFFMKFNDLELDAFDSILIYSNQENMQEIKKVKNEVRQLQYKRGRWGRPIQEPRSVKTISDIQRKTTVLTIPQLSLLHTFASEAAMNLNIKLNLQEFDQNEDIDTLINIYNDLCNLLSVVELEQEERISITRYKVNTNKLKN